MNVDPPEIPNLFRKIRPVEQGSWKVPFSPKAGSFTCPALDADRRLTKRQKQIDGMNSGAVLKGEQTSILLMYTALLHPPENIDHYVL